MHLTILKSIVVALLLANTGYFLWTHGVATPESAPAPTAAAAPAALASLKLVSEAPPAPPDTGIPPVGTIAGSSCVSVGPFHEVAETARAAATLRGAGHDPRQRVIDGEVWAGLWVYLPIPAGSDPSGAAPNPVLAKLKAAGMDDALEMPGPEQASVISLGLFNDQKRAQARIVQARALGLNPAVLDRKRAGNLYWIDIDLKPGEPMPDPAQLRGEAGRISRLELKSCGTVAPP